MFEKALSGTKSYFSWIFFLLIFIGIGFACYLYQYNEGLGITGMSRDVSWGFYIAQFTFLVGVAASAVMLVLPYYLHDVKAFGKITILGEFLAIASVVMCILFVTVDVGYPNRLLNILLYPSPNSILFWDFQVLTIYLLLNLFIGWNILNCGTKGCCASQMGDPAHLSVHSLGDQYPHRYGVPVCRYAGPSFLAHGHHGCPLSGFGLRRRSGLFDFIGPPGQTADRL